MDWFNNMKIKNKMICLIVVTAIFIMLISSLGYYYNNKASDNLSSLYRENLLPIESIALIRTHIRANEANMLKLITSSDLRRQQDYLKDINSRGEDVNKILKEFESVKNNQTVTENLNVFKRSLNDYRDMRNQVTELALSARQQEALDIFWRNQKIYEELNRPLVELSNYEKGIAEQTNMKNEADTAFAGRMIMSLSLLAIVFSLLLGLFIVRRVSLPIKALTEAADRMAAGDISARVEVDIDAKDETGLLGHSFVVMSNAIRALVKDVERLANEAVEGHLDARADVERHKGSYRKVIAGVNDTLDAVIGPLNVAAEYVDRISHGDIPPRVTANYRGDFNEIKNNLNQCIDAINALVSDANILAEAAVEGQLSVRADTARHNGEYRKIMSGFNETLHEIVNPIQEMSRLFQLLSDGDLTARMHGSYKGDFAELQVRQNETVAGLQDVIREIYNVTSQVSAGSRQIAASSQSLAHGASESASAVEEISAAMHEMDMQTKTNAENAGQANTLALEARTNAENGDGIMTQMQKAMEEINESGHNVAKIIKAIDEIAFQTNLLALNAAVEAARAGKHGKGFAVVAEEVRSLAQRSAEAAEETAELIEGSRKKTEVGVNLATETSKALQKIVSGTTKVCDIVGEIAAASREQAQGIGQIRSGLGQVDQVVQQTTASSEELSSAGEQLSAQALQLKNMVSNFKVHKQDGRYAAQQLSETATVRHQAKPRTMAGRQYLKLDTADAQAEPRPQAAVQQPEDVISLDERNYDKF